LPSSGCLQCFCDAQKAELGYKEVINVNYTAGEMANGTPYPEMPICYEYLKLSMASMILSTSFSYILIGFNYVLRTVVIMVVTKIGYATFTA